MNSRLSTILVVALFLAGMWAGAAEPLATPRPLPLPLQRLILPEVKFRDADLLGALRYLQLKADQQSRGAVQIPFTVELPADYQARYELTLDLQTVPFTEALRYLGGQAGVEFSMDSGRIFVRPLGTESAAQAATRQEKPAPSTNMPPRGLTGRLGQPAEAVTGGNYVRRSTGGVIQPEKSTYIRHRSLGGWSVDLDPRNGTGVNCIHPEVCPNGQCGCNACACRPRKN